MGRTFLRLGRTVLFGVAVLAGSGGPATAAQPAAHRADVVVYGGTAGGVIAAVAAAREGRSAVLVEPGRHLGGMTSGGLGKTDTGNRGGIGGYSREFYNRVLKHYTDTYGPDSEQVKASSGGFYFEPHVAENILNEMAREAGVKVVLGEAVEQVRKEGARIVSFQTTSGAQFTGKVYIDASYEGDLMARAGVSYHVGREGREVYGETLAGVQEYSKYHQWAGKISPFDEQGNLLPFVQPGPAGETGAGDKKVQAYNFRLCLTDRPDNQVPFPKPEGYDPARYELLARYLAATPGLKMSDLFIISRMPNGKTDINNRGPFSTDHIGANWDYPDANYAERKRIWDDHVAYTQGLLYFLANDPRVPEALRKEANTWGLSADEFKDTEHWPHQLYVREARRMIGQHVMTQIDTTMEKSKDDSVGLGSYTMDSHHVQRVPREDGGVINEGDFQIGVSPYDIAYRSLTPKPAECTNLLVPVCLSASHVAHGSIRMEPVFMILGQASGVAAALAVAGEASVQEVPIDRLQAQLTEQGAVLSYEEVSAPAGRQLLSARLPGIVVDDTQAEIKGIWGTSRLLGPHVDKGYLHDDNADKGKKSVRFTPELPRAGRYSVRIIYAPQSNRATNVPVVINAADGEHTVRLNQREAPGEGDAVSVGNYPFEAGRAGWVEIRNEGTDGHVIADAVQFLPADEPADAAADRSR